MIKEAIDRILELAPIEEIKTENTTLYTKKLYEEPELPTPVTLQLHRLQAMCDYITVNPDQIPTKECVLQIGPSGCDVQLLGPIFGYHEQRRYWAQVTSVVHEHKFGQWMNLERFNIYLRTHFEENDGLLTLLKVTENIVSNEVREVVDDGMAQQATVRKGIAGQKVEDVPRRVTLRPFVTFPEIDQPDRQFLLRLTKDDDEVLAGLFDCDGSNWRLVAADRVHDFLKAEIVLPEAETPLILV